MGNLSKFVYFSDMNSGANGLQTVGVIVLKASVLLY